MNIAATSCPGSGAQVDPVNAGGDLVCPICHRVCDTGWWDSALLEQTEEVPEHPTAETSP